MKVKISKHKTQNTNNFEIRNFNNQILKLWCEGLNFSELNFDI
jgi:hypothetical protein